MVEPGTQPGAATWIGALKFPISRFVTAPARPGTASASTATKTPRTTRRIRSKRSGFASARLPLLVPVAGEPRVRLPERARLRVRGRGVRVGAGGELGLCGGDELVLTGSVANSFRPGAQTHARLPEMLLGLVHDAEVRQA